METFKNLNPNQPNELLKCDEFYISYNPKTVDNAIGDMLSAITGIPNGKEETAIYGPDKIWYILNGDFRKEYEAVFPLGFEACIEVYRRNILHRSEWSTDYPNVIKASPTKH